MKRTILSVFLIFCFVIGITACKVAPNSNADSSASSVYSDSTSSMPSESDDTSSTPSESNISSSTPSASNNSSSTPSVSDTTSSTPSQSDTNTTPSTPSTPSKPFGNILSVAQLQLADGTGGMSYVITLKDEGFIIIDGGMGKNYYNRHSTVLNNYLLARTPKGQKPVILGWFITHFHYDHVENVAEFIKKNSDKLDVRGFYVNSPGKDNYADRQKAMEALVSEAMACYPNVVPHYLVQDEKIQFPHCTVDVLATSDFIGTDRATDPNSISAIFKINFDTGKSFLVTGDTTLNRVISLFNSSSSVYRPLSELKCDLYQVPHHGRPLGNKTEAAKLKECYEKLGISIVFMPVPKVQLETVEFYTDASWADNYYLINGSGADVFHHTQTVTVNMADLTYTIN